jgi:hypothetical protein
VKLNPGEEKTTSMRLYAGPQELEKIKALAPGLDLVVDYGWLTVLAYPLFVVLNWLNNLVHNWGVAIILLTVLIKLVFYPLSAASYKSMAKMRKLAPRLQHMKERYGDDRQKLHEGHDEDLPGGEDQSPRRLPAHPGADSRVHRPLLGACWAPLNCVRRPSPCGSRTCLHPTPSTCCPSSWPSPRSSR